MICLWGHISGITENLAWDTQYINNQDSRLNKYLGYDYQTPG